MRPTEQATTRSPHRGCLATRSLLIMASVACTFAPELVLLEFDLLPFHSKMASRGQLDPNSFPTTNWDDHLKFCRDGELHDGFFGMGNQFMDQPDLIPPADGLDFSLLHDASPTSPSVHLQPCSDTPQGLREWANSPTVSPTMDLLSDELIGSCNMADSEPFNPLLFAESANVTPVDNASFNSSVGSIPIPRQDHQTFSEYSFCSEPSLGYTGSSFNSDRSFDTLYAAHKQHEHLCPPPQHARALPQQQQIKSVHFQRPRRIGSTGVGSGVSKNTLSFIHCRPSEDSRRLLIYGAEHPPNGKKPRGRKNPLTPEQKKHAALMRRVKACESCRLRKEKVREFSPCQKDEKQEQEETEANGDENRKHCCNPP